jgi:hypothetical protein
MSNALYAIPLHVTPGAGCDMPREITGAHVIAYAAASDHLAAVKKAVQELLRQNFNSPDVTGTIYELSAATWQVHVASVWPEIPDHFPSGSELAGLIKSGSVFFGPFAGYKKP